MSHGMVSYGELRGTGRCVACGHQRWSQTVSHGNLAKSELTLVTIVPATSDKTQPTN